MEAFIIDWLSLVVRWLHVITGIAWIGASFYFVWLDNSLEPPPNWKQEKGIKGDLWAFHGGGIYEVAKYQLAPSTMPQHLHWFKWEAYSTWITGMCLMAVVYYLQADTYLVGVDSWANNAPLAIACSVIFLFMGFMLYELALTSGLAHRTKIFLPVLVAFIALFSWLAVTAFSGRGAFIHMGAVMGTIMVTNVYFGIIPAQKNFIKSIEAGETPDSEPMEFAKLRSVHNNYFTLPVLFCMISNHYPMLYGHRYSWLILLAVIAITAYARHFFNLRHRNIFKPSILVIAALAFLVLVSLLAWDRQQESLRLDSLTVSEDQAMLVVQQHCTVCHSAQPSFPGILAPPLGMVMNSPSDIAPFSDKMLVAVTSKYMPLANVTGMSEEERQILLGWLNSLQ